MKRLLWMTGVVGVLGIVGLATMVVWAQPAKAKLDRLKIDVAPIPEFAVYRHLRTREPCSDGVFLTTKLKIHRYMNCRKCLDIKPVVL
jgi:hypothetical protein